MSRSFDPMMVHYTDSVLHVSRGKTVYKEVSTGKEFCMYDANSEFAKKYPNLSFLHETDRHINGVSVEASEQALSEFEGYLSKLIEIFDRPENKSKIMFDPLTYNIGYVNTLIKQLPEEFGDIWNERVEATVKWFTGRLDPNFYYADYNQELFEDVIEKRAHEIDSLNNSIA